MDNRSNRHAEGLPDCGSKIMLRLFFSVRSGSIRPSRIRQRGTVACDQQRLLAAAGVAPAAALDWWRLQPQWVVRSRLSQKGKWPLGDLTWGSR